MSKIDGRAKAWLMLIAMLIIGFTIAYLLGYFN